MVGMSTQMIDMTLVHDSPKTFWDLDHGGRKQPTIKTLKGEIHHVGSKNFFKLYKYVNTSIFFYIASFQTTS